MHNGMFNPVSPPYHRGMVCSAARNQSIMACQRRIVPYTQLDRSALSANWKIRSIARRLLCESVWGVKCATFGSDLEYFSCPSIHLAYLKTGRRKKDGFQSITKLYICTFLSFRIILKIIYMYMDFPLFNPKRENKHVIKKGNMSTLKENAIKGA